MFRIFFIISFFLYSQLSANILQDAIDNAPEGSILKLPAGIYKGSINITKPITIIGKEDGVIIDGEGSGTVIKIKGSYVTLKNLKITGSGDRHDKLDAAISMIEGKQCEISNCVIDDSLFGIDMQMMSNSIISNNTITSKDVELGLRGDGLRLWYSNDNIIKNNSLIKSRDMVIWYSHGNEIVENYGTHCRYSLHLMHAGKNIIKNNKYEFNSVGIFFMYSIDSIATGNIIKSSLGATGMGIGLKDVSNFTLKDNTIIYCAQGIYIDRSPYEPDSNNWLIGNKFLYNSEALHFHSLSENNIIRENTILGNIEDVVNDSRGSKTNENEIESNYWDNYTGFDRDGDNIGDNSHRVYQYADQLWIYNPNVKFFYGSPVISLLNFLAKLAPFTKPIFLFEDGKPKVRLKRIDMAKVQTDRRKFVKYSTLGILGLVLGGGVLFSPYPLRAENRLRPPGAVPEKDFLALCIKCGQCLQVCPYHSIELADFGKGHGVGTPYIDADVRGCYACEAVPCVLACPSGALDHHTEKATDIKMGIAVLEFPDTCIAIANKPIPAGYNDKMHKFHNSVNNLTEYEEKMLEKFDKFEGKECTLCADMCPIPNPITAIAMVKDEGGGSRPEIYDGCIGCGVCQEVCPTNIPSIVVKPRVTYDEYYASKN